MCYNKRNKLKWVDMKSFKIMLISSIFAVSSFAVMGGQSQGGATGSGSHSSIHTVYADGGNKARAIQSTMHKVQCQRGERIKFILVDGGEIVCSQSESMSTGSKITQCTASFSCE